MEQLSYLIAGKLSTNYSYTNLDKHGYEHQTVNHLIEFVNKDGDHTNKLTLEACKVQTSKIRSTKTFVFHLFG